MNNITDLLTNLIPQPRLHFPIITYAPNTNNIHFIPSTCTQLAAMSFDRTNQMIKIDPALGKYVSVCMMFRGDLKPTDINTTIAYIQREHSFPVTGNMISPIFKVSMKNS
jgi:tubulin alpha